MKDRYRALKVAKERVFRPLSKDIYQPDDEIKNEKTEEIGFALDLWDIARNGTVDTFRTHYSTLLENAKKVHNNIVVRKVEQRPVVRIGSRIRSPSTLLAICPSDTSADLVEVLLAQNTWYCTTCSDNQDGLTKCCIWCVEKCHAGHVVESGEAMLEVCQCGEYCHKIKNNREDNPLDYQDSVSNKK